MDNRDRSSLVTNFEDTEREVYAMAIKEFKGGNNNLYIVNTAFDSGGNIVLYLSALHDGSGDLSEFWKIYDKIK